MILNNLKILAEKGVVEGNILIENGIIKRIGKNLGRGVNCKGKLAIPGLCNLHTHVPMVLLRGYEDDKNLHEWLEKVWEIEKKLTPKDIYISSKYGILEMIKTGTTCFLDMYFHVNKIADACKELGIRAFLGYGIVALEENKLKRELEETIRTIKYIKKLKTIITPVIAPHAIYTVYEEGLKKSLEIAKKYNLKIHMHLSETRKEVWDCYKKYKLRPVEYLKKINFLNSNCIFAHCGYLTKGEIRILKEHDCKVVSCTTSNMKLGTGGYFSYPEFKENNILVGLGTDGACSNNSLNMFLEMKFFSLMQKWFRWDSSIINSKEVFKLATENGYRILGIKGGKIAEGYLADIVLINIKDIPKPITNIYSNLVYSFEGKVCDVIINGKFVMKDYYVENEEKIISDFERLSSNIFG